MIGLESLKFWIKFCQNSEIKEQDKRILNVYLGKE